MAASRCHHLSSLFFVRSPFHTLYITVSRQKVLGQVPCWNSMFRSCVKRKGIVPQIENMIIQKVVFLGFRLLDTNHVSNYIAMRFLLTEPEIEHQNWSKWHYGKSHEPVGHLLSDPGVRILPSWSKCTNMRQSSAGRRWKGKQWSKLFGFWNA
jgi:hypothetical protein